MSCRSVRGALRLSKIPLATFCFWCAIPRRFWGDGDGELIPWRFRGSVLISCHVKCFLSFLRAPITTSWYPHPNWIVLGSKGIGFATNFGTCPAFAPRPGRPTPAGEAKGMAGEEFGCCKESWVWYGSICVKIME